MTEHLDHLLSVHHLLDESVDGTKVFLLLDKVFSASSGDGFGREQHQADHNQCEHRQGNTEDHHTDEHTDNGDQTVDDLRNTLADHLTEGIDIIGIDGHDIAVGMAVKIADRQFFHMFKHVVTERPHGSLGHIDHNSVVSKGRSHTKKVEASHSCDCHGQRTKIRITLSKHRSNIIIDQRLHEHGSLYIGKYAGKNQYNNDYPLNQIPFCHIIHEPSKNRHRVFHLGFHSGRHSVRSRHYSSPAFSSKSPPPCV